MILHYITFALHYITITFTLHYSSFHFISFYFILFHLHYITLHLHYIALHLQCILHCITSCHVTLCYVTSCYMTCLTAIESSAGQAPQAALAACLSRLESIKIIELEKARGWGWLTWDQRKKVGRLSACGMVLEG